MPDEELMHTIENDRKNGRDDYQSEQCGMGFSRVVANAIRRKSTKRTRGMLKEFMWITN